MKSRLKTRTSTAVLAAASISARATDAFANKKTVEALMQAMRTKDAASIRAFFDATGSQQYGDGTAKKGEAFLKWVEGDVIAAEAVVDDAVVTEAEGGIVVTGMIRNNRGYANKANFLFKVSAGKIISWHIRY